MADFQSTKFHMVGFCETIHDIARKYRTTPEWIYRNNYRWLDTYDPSPLQKSVPIHVKKGESLAALAMRFDSSPTAILCLWPKLPLEEWKRQVVFTRNVTLREPKRKLEQLVLPHSRKTVARRLDSVEYAASRLGTTMRQLRTVYPNLPLEPYLGFGDLVFSQDVPLRLSRYDIVPLGFVTVGNYIRVPDRTRGCGEIPEQGQCHRSSVSEPILESLHTDSVYYNWLKGWPGFTNIL